MIFVIFVFYFPLPSYLGHRTILAITAILELLFAISLPEVAVAVHSWQEAEKEVHDLSLYVRYTEAILQAIWDKDVSDFAEREGPADVPVGVRISQP